MGEKILRLNKVPLGLQGSTKSNVFPREMDFCHFSNSSVNTSLSHSLLYQLCNSDKTERKLSDH